jgi:hypothetical protein
MQHHSPAKVWRRKEENRMSSANAKIRAFTGGSTTESYMRSFMEIITEFRALAHIRKDTV